MKLFSCLLGRCIVVAPLLATSASSLQAQGVNRTLVTQVVVAVTDLPARLSAKLIPVNAESELSGNLNLVLAGDEIHVTGHLRGLDPQKLYRLQFPQTEEVAQSSKGLAGKSVYVPSGSVTSSLLEGGADVLKPDASGGVTIKTLLNGHDPGNGTGGIIGKPVVLVELPTQNENRKPVRVANAVVVVPEMKGAAVHSSKLDELEPGEHWF